MSCKTETAWVLFCICVAVAVSAVFYSRFSLNHDSSWYLVATRMFLDGGVLYRDIIEINPPLAFYITIPALVIADFVNLDETLAFVLYVSALGGLSVAWVYFIARRAGLENFAVLLVTAIAFIACFVLVMPEFGQREHFMLIFALPYFAYFWFRDCLPALSKGELSGIGFIAFLGLGLKPYFLLVPAGIVAFSYLRTRDVREFLNVPNFSLAVALALYLAFIALIHPLYLHDIVPTASLIYSAYGRERVDVLFRPEIFALVSLSVLALTCRKQLDRTAIAMLGGVIGATSVYLVQFKGWNYHFFPASFAIISTAIWIGFLNKEKVRQHVTLGVFVFVSVGICLGAQLKSGPYRSRTTESFSRFVEAHGTPVVVLSTNVWASFPFVNDVKAQWRSRYPAQWLLPGAFTLLENTDCTRESPLCDSITAIISDTRTRMVDDFSDGRPEVVFIDTREQKAYFGGVPFDYLEFLNEDSRFPALWRRYDKVGEAVGYSVYVPINSRGR